MSLTTALYSSFAGLNVAEVQIGIVSSNVTNADKEGYTKKSYELSYSTANTVSIPTGGQIVSQNSEPYLLEEVIGDITEAAHSQTISQYLSYLSDQMGTVDDSLTLSSAVDDLASAFDQLATTPEDTALKTQVVTQAESVAAQLRELSGEVQDLRTQADQEMSSVVEQINDLLAKIDEMNDQIAQSSVHNTSSADLEDERNQLLQDLAQLIEVDYFINSDNRLNIYVDGHAILTSQPTYLSYSETGSLTGDLTYPTQLSGISLNGVDITSAVDSGELGALLTLRDGSLADVQEKLDEYADTLMDQLNGLLNQGASLPPRNEIVGDTQGLAPADAFSATGSVRIAVMDMAGDVQDFFDFDLTSYATIGALVSDINAQLGGSLTASIDADGALQLVANNSDEGVAFNQLDSSVGADGESFSMFFGMNNLFTGTSASSIVVSSYLQENSEYVAVGRMSDDAALAIGDTALYSGDSDLAKEINNIFEVKVTFDQAGDFATQVSTLSDYVSKIMADIANKSQDALDNADTDAAILNQTLTALQNSTGVNVDEEMAQLVELQSKYEAAALLVSTIQDLFDTLIASVR